MGANDRILLDNLLLQQNAEQAPHLKPDDFFEFFCADQILKDYDLSPDEVEEGIVDGGGDGGIDSVYLFVNGRLLREDYDVDGIKKDVSIELIFVQSKNTDGFAESSLDKLRASAEILLDLSVSLDTVGTVYNEALLKVIRRFREAYGKLASRLPKLSISYCYAAKGSEVHVNVERKVKALETTLKGLFSDLKFSFQFLKDADLVALARNKPRASRKLITKQHPLQDAGAYVCLVQLSALFEFVTDSSKLARHIFDSNVRDHQGKTEVNSEIQDTLQTGGAEDFWWLNNGITVLADAAQYDGTGVTVQNPQIVNGVQTSTEVYNYFVGKNKAQVENRAVLVRILVPQGEESQDRIIKATNSQNAIAVATLRSTEKIHRDIEQFFRSSGLFYDRRKNFYKNEGRPMAKIIGIPYLAQALMAIALRRPDNARARPSSLLKADDQYAKVFNQKYPLELYLVCAALVRKVDEFLYTQTTLQRKDINNIRFYVAMLVSMIETHMPLPRVTKIAELDVKSIGVGTLLSALKEATTKYTELGGSDQVAKGPELARQLIATRVQAFVAEKKLKADTFAAKRGKSKQTASA
jgi:AIPR protein